MEKYESFELFQHSKNNKALHDSALTVVKISLKVKDEAGTDWLVLCCINHEKCVCVRS